MADTADTLERRLRLAHQARRAKEHQLDDVRRALCDVGVIEDADPHGHADLAGVIRQCGDVLSAPPFEPAYPRQDGDVTVLGPETFASSDGSVISWKGVNYVRQSDTEGAVRELKGKLEQVHEALDEARSWARHGYEIGQRHCCWSDYGVAPAWLTEGWPPHFDTCDSVDAAAPESGQCTATVAPFLGERVQCAQVAGHYDPERPPVPYDDPCAVGTAGGWHRAVSSGCTLTWSDDSFGATPERLSRARELSAIPSGRRRASAGEQQ